jgi:hypothetical protein
LPAEWERKIKIRQPESEELWAQRVSNLQSINI